MDMNLFIDKVLAAAKAAGIFARNDFERCAISFCCGGGQGVAAIFEKC